MSAILVVDDHPETRELLRTLFGYCGHEVVLAPDGPSALRMAAEIAPQLVVTDVVMPGMDGYTLLRELRRLPACRGTPGVMMSASLSDARSRALAERCGALSFVHKPFEPAEMLAAASAALSAPSRPVAAHFSDDPDVGDSHRALMADALASKVGELERLNRELEARVAQRTGELEDANRRLTEHANRDALTGLFNRRYLDDTLPREVERCRRAGAPAALARLEAVRRRVAGTPVEHAGRPLPVTFSAGLAILPGDGNDAATLLHRADGALYRAKAAGRDRVFAAEGTCA